MELAAAAGGNPQDDLQIGRGKEGHCPFGPFDQTDAIAFETLVEAGLKKLFCMGESIKIKVIYGYSRIFIRFDQGVGRALDPAAVTQTPQEPAGERGFPRAQVSLQINGQAWGQCLGEAFAGAQGGVLIGQVRPGGAAIII